MRCTNCGQENADSTNFCINCGQPLSTGIGVSQGSDSGNRFKVLSLGLGIAGIILCWIPFVGLGLGIAAIVCAVFAVRKNAKAKLGLIIAIAATVLALILTIASVSEGSSGVGSSGPGSISVGTAQAACDHEWTDATCDAPRTCSKCGATDGQALGHDVATWTVDVPATCTAAGSESGICSRCGKTVNQPVAMIDHTPGEWTVTKEPAISASGSVTPGTKSISCIVCGTVLQTEDYIITLTTPQTNAMRKAQSYLAYTAFSYSGLVDQLEFEGFSTEDATFAVDHCGADWNEQAAKKAKSYLSFSSFSRDGLIDQLEFEGFTYDQAVYGVSQNGY